DAEALSDYLLALRGLLDAIDEAGQPTLGRRLAALCAEEAGRPLLQARAEAALILELALVAGVPIDAWSAPPGVTSGRDLVREVEEHLRALLRDVACGYLKPELATTADEILLGSSPADVAPVPAAGPLSPPEAEPRVTRVAEAEPEPEPEPDRKPEDEPVMATVHEQPALVVDDFAWDLDDPGDYSAPV
ncbi:MAG: hypothetical protein ACJ76Z_14755, partial [Thermoleophilaceae bacterium]